MKISVRRRQALMVENGAFIYKVDYVAIYFLKIINLEMHQKHEIKQIIY